MSPSNGYLPLVSIIIPVYNGSAFMREAIDSALGQSYQNCEVLVINDGSSDATEKIAQSYGNRIRYYSKENGGVATALNLGIRESNGEFISWLSHDDAYVPEKIEKQVARLCALPECERDQTIIYSNWSYIDIRGKHIGSVAHDDSHDQELLDTQLYPICFGLLHGCSLLLPKKLFEDELFFDETLKTTQDYDLWLRAARSNFTYLFDSFSGVLSRRHPEQTSRIIAEAHQREASDFWMHLLQSIHTSDLATLNMTSDTFYKAQRRRFIEMGLLQCAEFCFSKLSPVSQSKTRAGIGLDFIKRKSTSFRLCLRTLYWYVRVSVKRLFGGSKKINIIAIITCFNEQDIIEQTVRYLIEQGVAVHVIDNWSTDKSPEIIAALAKESDLISWEIFPTQERSKTFSLGQLLKRVEEYAFEKKDCYNWFIHHDADEFREGPLAFFSLAENIALADQCGYNAVDYTLVDFKLTDDGFNGTGDIREHLRYFDLPSRPGALVQIKTWKSQPEKVDLVSTGGHEVQFPGRKVFPLNFILRHYPMRSCAQAERKIFRDRKPRWNREEKREKGWHAQYDHISEKDSVFVTKKGLHHYTKWTRVRHFFVLLGRIGLR